MRWSARMAGIGHLPALQATKGVMGQRSARRFVRWPSIHRCQPPAGWFCPRVRARMERQCCRIRPERTKTPAAAFLMAWRYKLTAERKKSLRRRFDAFWRHCGFLAVGQHPATAGHPALQASRTACLSACQPPDRPLPVIPCWPSDGIHHPAGQTVPRAHTGCSVASNASGNHENGA